MLYLRYRQQKNKFIYFLPEILPKLSAIENLK